MKTAKQTKLPRGLWVGRERKRPKYWTDPAVPEFYPEWRYRIRRRGLPLQMRVMPSYVTTVAQARDYARLQFQAAELVQTEELRGQVAAARARRGAVVSVGQYLTAFESIARARRLKCWQRAVSAFRLLVAVARGLIDPMGTARMNAEGGRRIRQVDALPLRETLERETVLHYMARMQATVGAATLDAEGRPTVNWDKNNPPVVNGTINSTLCMARSVFSPHSRLGAVAQLNVPWDAVERFCKLSLPEARHDVAEDIPTAAAFTRMMEAWAGLRGSADAQERELALVNELFRLLGLRSGELCMARLSWLHDGADGRAYLWVKNRPEEGWSCKTMNQAKLPLLPDLAARLRARCAAAVAEGIGNPFIVLPMVAGPVLDPVSKVARETPERMELIRGRHNAWLKGFIGEVRSGQGNHRLRKFCATRIYAEEMAEHHNSDRAAARVKEYLRHAKEATALIHYIAQDDERLKTVTDATLTGNT